MNKLAESVLHVLRLLDLKVTPLVVKAQYGDTKLIDSVRIDLAVVILAGNSFTTSRHANRCTVEVTIIILQRSTVSACLFRLTITAGVFAIGILHAEPKSISWHVHTSAIFNMISTG